ncbi:ABC transporter substrate-binding protein [Dethiobacter alkaliphilus]|uniref:ABC-type nitrate/sulfonate/bicarbonate transport systems periplasmic components-like protein n=1 Tax=Dethiobacter alkaliphilus AHT 1 TaxID=555088 RepID=C0GG29_DETAL|nr:ABC transporter substrate-binding protein [Dethiobacter alkaliphilus]EEG77718.1 ABC-type nitrate/sulfonate/bicarbonate transport systems periplasmic components-like protein [Dethiobacter alkaliphilus AHT 1]
MRKWFAFLVVVLLGVSLAGCGGSGAGAEDGTVLEDLTEVRIAYIAMPLASPQALMEEETGLFEELLGELGVTVEWVQTRGRDGTGPLMDNLEVDFIYIPANNSSSYISETSQFGGSDNFRIIAGSALNKDGNVLVGGPFVDSLVELDGMTVGIVNYSYVEEYMLNRQLETVGLSTEFIGGTVKVEHTDWIHTFNENFEAGEYDAITTRAANLDNVLDRVPEAKEIIRLNEGNMFGEYVPQVMLLARRDYIESYPQVVKAMLRAHVRATLAAEQAGAEVLGQKSMERYTYYFEEVLEAEDYPSYPLEHFVRTYQNALPTYDPDIAFFEDVYQYMSAAGHLDKSFEQMLNYNLLNEVLAEEGLAEVTK